MLFWVIFPDNWKCMQSTGQLALCLTCPLSTPSRAEEFPRSPRSTEISFALGGPYSSLLLARVAAMHTHVFAFVCAFFPSLLDSDSTFITVVQISAVQSKYWVGYTFPEWIQNHQEIFRLGETGILLKCECAIFLI